MKEKILFLCVHNSARSQMAEAFLKEYCPLEFEPHSAGLEPGVLNPAVVTAMKEIGIDLSAKRTQSVHELIKAGETFDVVITVCSESEAEGCPIFPGRTERLHWPFPDPSKLSGSEEERLARVRKIRNEIRQRIEAFCDERCGASTPCL